MRVLIIGGTGFIGSRVVRALSAQGHQVAVFHRGPSTALPRERVLPAEVQHIFGERANLANHALEFRKFSPDVVIDAILSSERQAMTTMDVFRGLTQRVVALSSGDVYRAAGILHGLEEGPLQPVPLTEDSELRRQKQPYSKEAMEVVRQAFPWVDDEYNKIPVERVIMSDPGLPGTVLRLPMTYGPGDPLHRLFPYLKRMDDGRQAILIQDDASRWRGPRGYVENVSAGIALAATSAQASGRIYNIASQQFFSELEWVQQIGRVFGWRGAVFPAPWDLTPQHLRVPYNSAQHWTMNSDRIRQELGYSEPVALDEALAQTITWELDNPPAEVDPKQFDYAAEDAALVTLELT